MSPPSNGSKEGSRKGNIQVGDLDSVSERFRSVVDPKLLDATYATAHEWRGYIMLETKEESREERANKENKTGSEEWRKSINEFIVSNRPQPLFFSSSCYVHLRSR